MKKVLFFLLSLILLASSKESNLEFSFSVSDVDKVVFSKGNLQYQASTKKWRFAEKPWDYVGEANENIKSTYSGWIDLFGWGTGNNPTLHSVNPSDYRLFKDWGNTCGLATPKGTTGKWRTLTKDEWDYVMFNRNTPSGVRFATANVNDVAGFIIVPDNWSADTYSFNNPNKVKHACYEVISTSEWESVFEPAGCVFLPNAGRRYGTDVDMLGSGVIEGAGYYWTSTGGPKWFDYLNCDTGDESIGTGSNDPYPGYAVRLVANVK